MSTLSDFCFFRELCIPFPSQREAEIAFRSLSVDAEPSRSGITRKMSYHDTKLNV